MLRKHNARAGIRRQIRILGNPGRHALKPPPHLVYKSLVIQVARRREHHVAPAEAVAVVAEELRLLQPPHRFLGSQDRLAQRMAAPEVLGKDLVHQVVGVVLVHLDLFEDHAPLTLDIALGKGRVQHQVAQHIECRRHMLIQHLDVEADGFLARKGVQVAADRVHFARNPLRRSRLGSLEHHVFHKMRDPVQLRDLMPRARPHPYAHCHRAHVLHPLSQDGQPIREDRSLHTAFIRHKVSAAHRALRRTGVRAKHIRATQSLLEHFLIAVKMLYACLLPDRFDAT